MISARHSHVARDKLRQKSQIEANENHEGAKPSPAFRIHSAANLGPPVVQTTQISHQSSTDHDVMEVCNNEVGVSQVNVYCESGEKQSSHATDREQSDESKRVKHRRVV